MTMKMKYLLVTLILVLVLKLSATAQEITFNGSWGGRTLTLALFEQNGLQYVFSSTGRSIFCFDVSRPTDIKMVGNVDVSALSGDLAVYGTYLFAPLFDSGFAVISIADPTRPVVKKYFKDYGAVSSLSVDNAVLGVCTNASIEFFDISDPTEPVLLRRITDSLGPFKSVLFTDSVAVALRETSETGGGSYCDFYRFSESNYLKIMRSPKFLYAQDIVMSYPNVYCIDHGGPFRSFAFSGDTVLEGSGGSGMIYPLASSTRLAIYGNYLFSTCEGKGVTIYDISQPMQPVSILRYELLEYIFRPVFYGNYCFFPSHNQGVLAFDCQLPETFSRLESTEIPGYMGNVHIDGEYAYAFGNGKLVTFNISDLTKPMAVNTMWKPRRSIYDVVTIGDYLLCAYRDSLVIYDNRDKSAPAFHSVHHISPMNILISKEFAFITCIDHHLRIYNIKNFPKMDSVAEIKTSLYPRKMVQHDDDLYILCGQAGAKTFMRVSVEDPNLPLPIQSYYSEAEIASIAVKDSFAFIVDRYYNFRTLRISDSLSPRDTGGVCDLTDCFKVEIAGSVAIVADGFFLTLVDIKDPVEPYVLNKIPISGHVTDFAISGSTIVLAANYGGFQVFTMDSILSMNSKNQPYRLISKNSNNRTYPHELGLYTLDGRSVSSTMQIKNVVVKRDCNGKTIIQLPSNSMKQHRINQQRSFKY